MKRWIVAAVIFMAIIAVATPGRALLRKDLSLTSGKLLSVNTRTNQVTIDDGSRQPKTFQVKQPIDRSLTAGKNVIVMYKIGTTDANWVKPARQHR